MSTDANRNVSPLAAIPFRDLFFAFLVLFPNDQRLRSLDNRVRQRSLPRRAFIQKSQCTDMSAWEFSFELRLHKCRIIDNAFNFIRFANETNEEFCFFR